MDQKTHLFLYFSFILFFSLTIISQNFASSDNIYQLDSLQLQLSVNSSFQLSSEAPSAKIKEVQAELFLFPTEDYRQKIAQLETSGLVAENKITYFHKNPTLTSYGYGYLANIQTNSQTIKVTKKIAYPLTSLVGVEEYTLPTKKIDSNNPAIISKAHELAAGKDDLFEVAFSLATWVSENIKYDLNDLTTNSAQKASWVLENKQGVCDEMTSLFVAMARSLGIPAKFVSGISYTENPEVLAALGKNWAGHGWAEVYFPDVGWVSFDLAFNEFGYIDVTHIKLRDGFDPDEPATKFEWLSDQVQLESFPLTMDVKIKQKGQLIPEELQLEMEILSPSTAFGSYNLIKGIVKNPTNHYSAVSLDLAVPSEVEITAPRKKTLLLSPQEVQEAFWIVKLSQLLDSGYNYQLPLIIYTEKNLSVKEELQVGQGAPYFDLSDIQNLIPQKEESYSRKLSFDCTYPLETSISSPNQAANISFDCKIKNIGDEELVDLSLCLGSKCEVVNLLPGRETEIVTKVQETDPGWHYLAITAKNKFLEKKDLLSYMVLDQPLLELSADIPPVVSFGDTIPIHLKVQKISFNPPKNVIIILRGLGREQRWEVPELSQDLDLETNLDHQKLTFSNKLILEAQWDDGKNTKKINQENKEFIFSGESKTFSDKLKMILNALTNFFLN